MDIAAIIFLTSGLFLGWSLGANDAANVFGTAVGTRMIRFGTAAALCSVFVVLGAVFGGAGAADTLGRLGAVDALAGSFMAAFSAGLAVYLMTKLGLSVSTTQAIVGAIMGWNYFSETLTDSATLSKILITWLVCPLLAAGIAVTLYSLTRFVLQRANLHLLRVDSYTRLGLILAGMFGSYSLGANNIGNVMGVFIPAAPFTAFSLFGLYTVSPVQQLFFLGALAIGVGVITYSRRVMLTVGSGLAPLTPVAAWVVVMSHSLVLFLFASQGLENFLARNGLPTIPLVPVSSSQVVVGAIVGIGLMQGGRNIRWRMLGSIGIGWAVTPLIAGVVCFVGLFFLQNVFSQQVYRATPYMLSPPALERLAREGVDTTPMAGLKGRRFASAVKFRDALRAAETGLSSQQESRVIGLSELHQLSLRAEQMPQLELARLSPAQQRAVSALRGRIFAHKWMLADALARRSPAWRLPTDTVANKLRRRELMQRLQFIYRLFGDDQ